jgi:hypothetical protein
MTEADRDELPEQGETQNVRDPRDRRFRHRDVDHGNVGLEEQRPMIVAATATTRISSSKLAA